MKTREIEIILESQNEQERVTARKRMNSLYEEYLTKFKSSAEFNALNPKEQQIFQAREETRNGKKVVIYTFASREAADAFIKSLKAEGIKFSVEPKYLSENDYVKATNASQNPVNAPVEPEYQSYRMR